MTPRARKLRRQIVWSAGAGADVRSIAAYIRRDGVTRARRVRDRLIASTNGLADHPERGRVVPELREIGIDTWREVIVAPYRIVYRIETARIVIALVADSRRDMEQLMLDRILSV